MLAKMLSTTRYVGPGVYIGKIYNPTNVPNMDIPRIPCVIGRASDFKMATDQEIVRGYIVDEPVLIDFSKTPYKLTVKWSTDGEKTNTYITDQYGRVVPPQAWKFTEGGDSRTIESIISNAFDSSLHYTVSYQSDDPLAPDILPIRGLEAIRVCGRSYGSEDYFEGFDYRVITEVLPPIPGDLNTGAGLITINSDTNFAGKSLSYTVMLSDKAMVDTPVFGTITPDAGNTGSGVIAFTTNNDYLSPTGDTYTFTVSNFNTDEFDIDWASTTGGTSGTVHISPTNYAAINIEHGIQLSFTGLPNFNDSDIFTFSVTVQPEPVLTFGWWSSNPLGGSDNIVITPLNKTKVGLEKNIFVDFNNLTDFEIGDVFTIYANNTDTIVWDLLRERTEIIKATDIYPDYTGNVTNYRKWFYVALNTNGESIDSIVSVKNKKTGVLIPYQHRVNTAYIAFSVNPGTDIEIVYKYRNAPGRGKTYFITYQYTRPASEYGVVRFITRADYAQELGPIAPTNHLRIHYDQAYESYLGLSTCAYVQIADGNGNGIYTTKDYADAILAMRLNKEITDVNVLANANVLDVLYQVVTERADPFEAKETLTTVGFPVGTRIGFSEREERTHYWYWDTFQVFADGHARGCFAGVAQTWADRTIRLEDGTEITLRLDGSYIAAQLTAMGAAFDMPWETELRKQVPGYSDIQTFDDAEIRRLGKLRYSWLQKRGARIEVGDIMTFDTSSNDTALQSAMRQKHFVVRYMRRELDATIIGIVPSSVMSGVSLVLNAAANLLRNLISRGIIAPYEEGGSPRDLSPGSDIVVWRDDADKTIYNMLFYFFIKYPIKQIRGLYSVDGKAW